ncbi:hypothetical protein [Sphingomonas sp. Y38-1Y]|uniref:hypothetical protein n=1 Tax=Sphingomonas sp. Y38-1Y TaxID=3078265 RepID=UPI0028F020FE|nr:hypothetical protein [Sphingomonas sp. Y38-1Y]
MRMMVMLAATTLAACGTSDASTDNGTVVLRNLADTEVAAPRPEHLKIVGQLIPTPSDSQSRYYLLRHRTTLVGTSIAIMRQEKGDRVAYARTEVDCARRLFHVVGVASTRGRVESDVAHDGPLRSIHGLPLREELAAYVCERSGTPLRDA